MAKRRFITLLLSAGTLLGYLLAAYLWFESGLQNGEAPLVFSWSSLVFPAVLLVGSIFALLRLAGPPRLFPDPVDTRWALGLSGLAAFSRLVFLPAAYGLFSSDAAAQGVMALHILEGKHHPVLLYNLSYIGSPKAHLTALVSVLVRDPVVSFEVAAILMFAVFVGSLFALAREVLPRREAVVAGAYAIVCPGFLTAWGAHNDGSYVDVLALGTALMVLGARLLKEEEGAAGRAFWMGVLAGLSFWVHILATYYMLAAALVFLGAARGRRTLGLFAAFLLGFAVGDFPVLLWNGVHEWQSFRWWTHAEAGSGESLVRTFVQLKGAFLTAMPVLAGYWPAATPPWPAAFSRAFLLPLLPLTWVVFLFRARHSIPALRRLRLTPETFLLLDAVMVVLVFSVSSFGWLAEEPRYLLFLFSVIPIFLAATLGALPRPVALVVGGLLLAVNLQGSAAFAARAYASAPENRKFLEELDALGIRTAHTDYFISYKYNFLSHGRLTLTSALGPSETEWYQTFRKKAAQAEPIALIPRSFRMARRLCRRLDALGVHYRRADLLYPVIYDLSEKVGLDKLR